MACKKKKKKNEKKTTRVLRAIRISLNIPRRSLRGGILFYLFFFFVIIIRVGGKDVFIQPHSPPLAPHRVRPLFYYGVVDGTENDKKIKPNEQQTREGDISFCFVFFFLNSQHTSSTDRRTRSSLRAPRVTRRRHQSPQRRRRCFLFRPVEPSGFFHRPVALPPIAFSL